MNQRHRGICGLLHLQSVDIISRKSTKKTNSLAVEQQVAGPSPDGSVAGRVVSAIWLPSFLVALRDAASLTVGPCDDRTRTESKDDAPAAAADSQRETGREQRTVTDDCRKVGIFVNVNGPPVDGTGPEITFFFSFILF